MRNVEPTIIVDITGLKCPVPLINTRKAIRSASQGEIIQFTGTRKEDTSRKEILMALENLEQPVLESEYNPDSTSWYIIIRKM